MSELKYPKFSYFGNTVNRTQNKKYFVPVARFFHGLTLIDSFSLMNVSFNNYNHSRNMDVTLTLNSSDSS